MGGEPAGHPEDLAANPLGRLGRIVEDHRRGHHHVERAVGEGQPLPAGQQDVDPVQPLEDSDASMVELSPTEVDADQRDVDAGGARRASSLP